MRVINRLSSWPKARLSPGSLAIGAADARHVEFIGEDTNHPIPSRKSAV